MYRTNIIKVILYILSVTITFYLSKLTAFSPIYLIYIITLFFGFYILKNNKYYKVSGDILILLILLIYLLVFHNFFLLSGSFINLFLSILSYILVRQFGSSLDSNDFLKIIKNMIFISVFTLFIDSVYRLLNPTYPDIELYDKIEQSEDKWFYIYKYNSIMFTDSNTTALVVIILFFLILSLSKDKFTYNFTKVKLILILLLILTLSRAAILTFLISLLIYYYLKQNNIFKKILFLFFPFISLILIIINFNYFLKDGSFKAKIYIYDIIVDKISKMSLYEIFFGVGVGEAQNFLKIHTHLLYFTYFIETGIIGLFLINLFFIYYFIRYNKIIIISVFLLGLSYFMYLGSPFLFVPLALLANLKDKEYV